MELEKRVEKLEKRVTELEGKVPEQKNEILIDLTTRTESDIEEIAKQLHEIQANFQK